MMFLSFGVVSSKLAFASIGQESSFPYLLFPSFEIFSSPSLKVFLEIFSCLSLTVFLEIF